MQAIDAFLQAQQLIKPLVMAIGNDQWHNATPCSEWDVRALVNHLAYEDAWMSDVLAGKTIAEVGKKYDGDLLGEDPKASWQAIATRAKQALKKPGVMKATVHLSYGEHTGEYYINEMVIDRAIHAWDLAQGLGKKLVLPDNLAKYAYAALKPEAEDWRESGAFGSKVTVPDSSDTFTKLLALSGRQL